ncbi:MAG: ABC transporter permease [Acidilobaceae archaeon]|nr:ABC transporter permease [Acidilobaceae archaeon]MCX8166173.1 ABC transporter permease [Acidilobaceae archaeon]
MSKTLALVQRELLSLFRDRYVLFSVIVAPFLSMLLIGGITVAAISNIEVEQGNKAPSGLSICLEDPGDEIAAEVAKRMGAPIGCGEARYLLTIKEGFGDAVERGQRGRAVLRAVTTNPLSLPDATATVAVNQLLEAATLQVAIERGIVGRPPPALVEVERLYVVRGKVMSESVATVTASLMYALLFLAMLIHFVTIQVGSISVGIEKEAKIAESLFTYPLERWQLVTGKIAGVLATSLVTLLSLLAGLLFTYVAILSQVEVGGRAAADEVLRILGEASFGLPQAMVTGAALLTLALTSSLLGTLFGYIFARDIRGALVASSYVGLVTALPVLLDLMLLGSEGNPIFYVFPIYPPLEAIRFSLFEAWGMSLLSLLLSALYALALFFLNTKAFQPSLIIYGIRALLRGIVF